MKMNRTIGFLVLAVMLGMPSVCGAGALSSAISEWSPAGIYGQIIGISGDIVTVKEFNVLLVNDKIGKTVYKTSIMDINGKEITSKSLSIGKYVIAKGSFAYDPSSKLEVVVAKEIYLLPREMTENEMNKYPMLNEVASPWK